MNRREFLHSAAGAVAATSLLAADKKDAIPIIDTHQHLWDLSKFKLPWIKKGSVLDRSYVMADYNKATEGLNVVKTIYMEVAVDPTQLGGEAEYVLDICKDGKQRMVGAVIGGRPASDGFKDHVTKHKDGKYIKGVRQVIHEDQHKPGLCLEKPFIEGVRFLGKMDLSFDICIRPGELQDAARLIDACPDTRFILDHCGNANVQAEDRTQWRKDMETVAKRKNVVCKVSGIVASAKPEKWSADDLAPIVNHTAEAFGKDRIMFGGDWPVCTLAASYRQWVEALQSIVKTWSVEDQKKLFHDNAVRVYRLK
jgi:predicted TIM-barrel fold metal-dependent hydrolase